MTTESDLIAAMEDAHYHGGMAAAARVCLEAAAKSIAKLTIDRRGGLAFVNVESVMFALHELRPAPPGGVRHVVRDTGDDHWMTGWPRWACTCGAFGASRTVPKVCPYADRPITPTGTTGSGAP